MNPSSKIAGPAVAIWLLLTGCTGSTSSATVPDNNPTPSSKPMVMTDDVPDGRLLYRQYCITCHGTDGQMGINGAKDLSKSTLSLEQRIEITAKGKNMMTPFNELLEPAEIEAVAKYTFTLVR